jgi:NTP pyrophosphatase (non-canonical NTP hydrolase)
MNFDDYQSEAAKTAIYPKGSIAYLALGLNGEAGEVAEIIKRAIRRQEALSPEQIQVLALELGDCLWYIANMAREHNIKLSEIATSNIMKLQTRQKNNTLEGRGNHR